MSNLRPSFRGLQDNWSLLTTPSFPITDFPTLHHSVLGFIVPLVCYICKYVFGDRVSHHVAQAGLEPMTVLSQPRESWDYRHALPGPCLPLSPPAPLVFLLNILAQSSSLTGYDCCESVGLSTSFFLSTHLPSQPQSFLGLQLLGLPTLVSVHLT